MVDAGQVLDELCLAYRHQSVAEGKQIPAPRVSAAVDVYTDAVLLRRVLGNLPKNALEASATGQTVSVSFVGRTQPIFHVHNDSVMSDEVRAQVFQRSFSTKDARSRGLGTYSVKLLTENYLGGTVAFSSFPGAGTTFTVVLPAGSRGGHQ